jgi:hypothetical protein
VLIPVPEGTRLRKGIHGENGLTKQLVDQTQNYYGMAIRNNIGDKDGTIKAIRAIYGHLSSDYQYCPDEKNTWCKFKRQDPKYKPNDIAPEVLKAIEPIFGRLSESDSLDSVQRGDTQNPNESLHSLIWRRAPKHLFTSIKAIKVSIALAVIHRNAGNVGLICVMEKMRMLVNNITRSSLGVIDVTKEKQLVRKNLPETKKRRQLIRGLRKKAQDKMEATEETTYKAGAFDVPHEDQPGPGPSTGKRQPRKRKGRPSEDQDEPSEDIQPAKKRTGRKQQRAEDKFAHDAASLDSTSIPQPERRSDRIRQPTWRTAFYYVDDDDDDDEEEECCYY